MEELAEELSEIDLPCKTIEDVVDEFHIDEFVNHRSRTRMIVQPHQVKARAQQE